MGGGLAPGDGVTGGADSLEGEEEQHPSARTEEEDPSSDAFDERGGGDSPCQVPNLEDAVDEELGSRTGNTDGFEHFVEVVGDEAVSGPLREPSESDDDRQTLTVTGGLDQGHPTNGSSDSLIEIDGGLDFFELVLDERILFITVGMIVSQDVESLGIPPLANEPTRRFGAEPEETELEDGGHTLEGGWSPPSPRGVELESTEGAPGGDNSTGVPERVVEGGQRSAVGGVGQFGDQHGGASLGECETEANEETSANEHANALGSGLDSSSDNLLICINSQWPDPQRKRDRRWAHHDASAKQDSGATTEAIGEVGGEWQCS